MQSILEGMGGGGLGGFVVSVLVALGFRERMKNVETGKQDKGVCENLHENLCKEIGGLRSDIQHLSGRIDNLINHKVN